MPTVVPPRCSRPHIASSAKTMKGIIRDSFDTYNGSARGNALVTLALDSLEKSQLMRSDAKSAYMGKRKVAEDSVGSEAEGAGATEFEDGAEENQLIPLSYHCLPAYVAPDLVPSYETLHVLESTRSP